MDDQKYRDIAREEAVRLMDENSTVNQFALSQTSFHTHNGIDSQKVAFINLSDTPTSYYGQAGSVVTVNSTENALIFAPAATVYRGVVESSGTTIHGPTGWTVSRSGAGDYDVNMFPLSFSSFGGYAVVASCDSSCYVNVQANSGTVFRLLCLNASGVPTDANVCFMMMPTSGQ